VGAKNMSKSIIFTVLCLVATPIHKSRAAAVDFYHSKDYWQSYINQTLQVELNEQLALELSLEELLALNNDITKMYAAAFLRSLDSSENQRLLWPGLAAYASELVGTRMLALAREVEQAALLSRPYEDAVRLLALGNILVAHQTLWQFRAYLEEGKPALEHHYLNGDISLLEWQAWSALSYDPDFSLEVSEDELEFLRLFSYYEQKMILQPHLFSSKHSRLFGLIFSNLATSPLPIGSPFSSSAADFSNLSSFEQRWSWFQSSVLPEWTHLWTNATSFVLKDLKLLLEEGHLGATRLNGFQTFSGCQKQEHLWNNHILSSIYDSPPPLVGSGWRDLLAAWRSGRSLERSFTIPSDVMPSGREKVVHRFGSVALVEVSFTNNHPYTGLFRENSICAIARISLVAEPGQAQGVVPGIAIKLFVDSQPSKNIHLMHSLDGQGYDGNIFKHAKSNRLPPARNWFIRSVETVLSLGNLRLRELKLDHIASIRLDGSRSTHQMAPWKMLLQPSNSHGFDSNNLDFREQLSNIEAGSVLYDIYAVRHQGATAELIGQLSITEAFVSSKFADERLFFQHGPN